MQVIKALVVGMGVLIILGLGLLAYGLASKFGETVASDGSDKTVVSAAAFGTIRADLPAGATVADVQIQDGTMMVRLALPDGGAQIMVFRLSDGRQTGTIELQPLR